MKRPGRRQVKTRQSKIFKLPQGITLFWAGVIVLFFMGGGMSSPNQLLLWWLIALSAATPLAWWWAIRVVRIQNAAGKSLQELQTLPPDAFEEWAAARFRDLGYSVKLTGTYGDRGIDFIAEKPGETAVIQCKNYKAWSVGEPVLRDLFGAMHDFGANRAYLVTTGKLSRPAAKWLAGKPIEVWDGDYVARLSMQMAPVGYQATTEQPGASASISGETTQAMNLDGVVSTTQSHKAATRAIAKCPKCGSQLVKRQNKRTGEPFLGCSSYPACRHTQP